MIYSGRKLEKFFIKNFLSRVFLSRSFFLFALLSLCLGVELKVAMANGAAAQKQHQLAEVKVQKRENDSRLRAINARIEGIKQKQQSIRDGNIQFGGDCYSGCNDSSASCSLDDFTAVNLDQKDFQRHKNDKKNPGVSPCENLFNKNKTLSLVSLTCKNAVEECGAVKKHLEKERLEKELEELSAQKRALHQEKSDLVSRENEIGSICVNCDPSHMENRLAPKSPGALDILMAMTPHIASTLGNVLQTVSNIQQIKGYSHNFDAYMAQCVAAGVPCQGPIMPSVLFPGGGGAHGNAGNGFYGSPYGGFPYGGGGASPYHGFPSGGSPYVGGGHGSSSGGGYIPTPHAPVLAGLQSPHSASLGGNIAGHGVAPVGSMNALNQGFSSHGVSGGGQGVGNVGSEKFINGVGYVPTGHSIGNGGAFSGVEVSSSLVPYYPSSTYGNNWTSDGSVGSPGSQQFYPGVSAAYGVPYIPAGASLGSNIVLNPHSALGTNNAQYQAMLQASAQHQLMQSQLGHQAGQDLLRSEQAALKSLEKFYQVQKRLHLNQNAAQNLTPGGMPPLGSGEVPFPY